MLQELKLRLQQYKAMFIKRFFNYIRFRVGFVWQFLLPVLFVLLGLVLAVTIPAIYTDDIKRKITLTESAPSVNTELFWADFSLNEPSFIIKVLLNLYYVLFF